MSDEDTGIRNLKDHLSAYLRKVKAGDTVTITGTPVGRIVPIEASVEKRLEQLVETGLVEWNGKRFEASEPVAEARSDTVGELVVEEREGDGS